MGFIIDEEKSEFGKGFIYNLVLFSKHWWSYDSALKINNGMVEKYPNDPLYEKDHLDLWFNQAGDHFEEFEIPKRFENTEIGKLAKELQDEAVRRRSSGTTLKEFENFFERLEKLTMMIDEYLDVNPIKAINK